MLVTLRGQRVKCSSIRAVSYDRSNILNSWWERGKTNKQTNNINLDNFSRSQMLLKSNILCSKLTPWFGTEVSNIIIKSDACYLSLTHWTSLEASFSVNFFLICRNHIKIQLKHSNIKFLLKVQWSDGECAQS